MRVTAPMSLLAAILLAALAVGVLIGVSLAYPYVQSVHTHREAP